jgi:hypothetical protein
MPGSHELTAARGLRPVGLDLESAWSCVILDKFRALDSEIRFSMSLYF